MSAFRDGMVSEEEYLLLTNVSIYISLPMYCLAFLCNVLSLAVYRKSSFNMNVATRCYLKYFTLSELLYVFVNVVNEIIIMVIGNEHHTNRTYLIVAMFIITPVGTSARKASFCLSFVTCCERFLAIGFPLKSKTTRIVKHPRVFSAVILSIIVSYHTYIFWGYDVRLTNTTRNEFSIQISSYYLDNPELFSAWNTAGNIVFSHLALLGCFVTNIFLFVVLRRQKIVRRCLYSIKRQEKENTIAILISTLVFTFLSYPTYINSFIAKLNNNYGMFVREHFLFMMMTKIGLFMEILSNLSIFIFYVICCRKFRHELLDLFGFKPSTVTCSTAPTQNRNHTSSVTSTYI